MANGKCSKCSVVLDGSNCSPGRISHGGPCRPCKNEHIRKRYRTEEEFRIKDAERHALKWLLLTSEEKRALADRSFFYKYGVTVEDFDARLKEQNNKCDLCSQNLALSVDRKSPVRACQDHDHKTKKLRSILCNRCNLLIGYANDDIEILKKAIAYLMKHSLDSTSKIECIDVG